MLSNYVEIEMMCGGERGQREVVAVGDHCTYCCVLYVCCIWVAVEWAELLYFGRELSATETQTVNQYFNSCKFRVQIFPLCRCRKMVSALYYLRIASAHITNWVVHVRSIYHHENRRGPHHQ